MTDELTDEELARIDALAAAALSGPWECVAEERLSSDGEIAVFHHHVQVANDPDDPDDAGEFVLYGVEPSDRRTNFSPTERFVAESRTLVPRLVAALRSERTENRVMHKALDRNAAELERARRDSADLHATWKATEAELERERTQNRELRDALTELLAVAVQYVPEPSAAYRPHRNVLDAARAALSTQENRNEPTDREVQAAPQGAGR